MTSIKTKIRGMDVEITEEGAVFTGMLLDDPSNVLRDAIAEIERLQEIGSFAEQLALAYKREADKYESVDGKNAPWVQFARGRQDAYESVMRWFVEARQALERRP